MKKYIAFLLALIFCICTLASCDTTPENTPSKEDSQAVSQIDPTAVFDTTPRDLDFVGRVIEVGGEFSSDPAWLAAFERGELIVVQSNEDVEWMKSFVNRDKAEILSYLDSLGEGFFDQKLLLITFGVDSSTGYKYEITGVKADENGVTLKYNHVEPSGDVEPAITRVLVIAEIKKSDVSGCEKFNFQITEKSHRVNIDFKENWLKASFKEEKLQGSEMLIKYQVLFNGGYLDTFEIKDEKDCKAFISYLGDGSEELIGFFEELPEDYFDEKMLLVNDFTTPRSGYERKVSRVEVSADRCTVEYYYSASDAGDCVMCPLFVLVEVDKSDVSECAVFGATCVK